MILCADASMRISVYLYLRVHAHGNMARRFSENGFIYQGRSPSFYGLWLVWCVCVSTGPTRNGREKRKAKSGVGAQFL